MGEWEKDCVIDGLPQAILLGLISGEEGFMGERKNFWTTLPGILTGVAGIRICPLAAIFLVLPFVLSSCDDLPRPKRQTEDHTSLEWVLKTPTGKELTPEQRTALSSLSEESRTPLRLQLDPITKLPVWIGLQLPVVNPDPKVNARAFLTEFGDLFQVDKLGVLVENADVIETDCCYKVRFSQELYDIPVYAAAMEFVQTKEGWVSNIRALLIPDVSVPPGSVTLAQAKDTLKEVLSSRLPEEAFDLLEGEKTILNRHIFSDGSSHSYVSWRFHLPAHTSTLNRDWFIDASSGEYLAEIPSSPISQEPADHSEASDDWPLPIHNVNYGTGTLYDPDWSDTGDSPAREPCDDATLMEVREDATETGSKTVAIDCDLTLEGNETITKKLILEGPAATGVTVDCNGAKLDGGEGTPNYGEDMIEVRSRTYIDEEDGERKWERPENVIIRDCEIIGSVRVWGVAKNGEGNPSYDGRNYHRESSRTTGHVAKARTRAPKNIVFDTVIITGVGRNPVYFAPGVTYSKVINSEIKGKSDAVAVYLDAESAYNTIKNNDIHVVTAGGFWSKDRPEMAIDGSSYNKIMNNRFSALNHGGIYLYRNCGLNGVIRHSTPSHNKIINNIFFYKKYTGGNPSVYLGSRDGGGFFGQENPVLGYCDDDEGYLDVGSSKSNEDKARYNIVMQNQIYKRSLDEMIRSKDWDDNSPNYIDYNETVTEDTVVKDRLAGCYKSDAYMKDFLLHAETIELFEDAMGRPYTVLLAYTCNDGVGEYVLSTSDRRVVRPRFDCQVNGNNEGCETVTSCPNSEEIIGASAACNLEYGTVSSATLATVRANIIKVIKASDEVSKGSCHVGSTSLKDKEKSITEVNGLNEVSVGCKEHDKNGGDCHIKGILYCY